MEYQPDAPWNYDEPPHHSVHSNISFTPGSHTSRPAQQQLPTPPRCVSQTIMAPHLHNRHIPNAEDKTSVHKEQVPPLGDSKSTYTRECVKRFKDWHLGKGAFSFPETREDGLTMVISMRDFLDFKKVLHVDDDERFPRYSYDSLSSALTIQCMSSPIHEQVVSTVSEGFTLARSNLPTSLRRRIDIVGNQQFTDFKGAYYGSEKTPDTAVKIEDATGTLELKFVLEIGLTETYDELVQDAKTWLEGTETVSVVMLVKMQEDPGYQCPTQNLSDEEFAQLGFPRGQEINLATFALDGPYGPAVYKGFTWVGRFTGFTEMWKRDPVSGLATRTRRYNIFTMGDTTVVYFFLSDFIDVTFEDDHHVPCNWGLFLSNLGRYIKELAADRCRQTLIDREGRANILDRDYQPSPSIGSS
ncbi:hypothetical protein L873DRAFT_1795254 [Choiromyces venosus 120613-1]|uniref:Uncharacterized protein n=1 Tax=Choiromyces venosus 120613-1 TaxID=1336337 RepID=A0A3N4IXC5_9PEZI|nr:hypothetical protein L873DRAFT_1795254 [Choiromyces venosus 120613-1]